MYERLFTLRQDGHPLADYYYELKVILDELDFYQSLILDLKALQRYCDELALAKKISGFDASLRYQVRGQIFGGDTVPPLLPLCPVFVVLLWAVTPLLLPLLLELKTLRWLPGVVAEVVTRVHDSALIVAGRITCLISAGTSLKNLNGLRLLMLLFQLLTRLLLLLSLCRYLSLTMIFFVNFMLPSRHSLHIVPCITQLKARVPLLLLLLNPEY